MLDPLRVALIGDYREDVIAHRAIPVALRLAAEACDVVIAENWIHTSRISDAPRQLAGFHGVWCVPASPYANMQRALEAIRFARESGMPFLGTCGGFQHALIEWARNVCGIAQAEHAESAPESSEQVIVPLACSLVERRGRILLAEGSRLRAAYRRAEITEEYHCSYSLNSSYAERLLSGDLRAAAHDLEGEVRGVELTAHPFFVAMLFQPERRALRGEAPPPVVAFSRALISSALG